MTRGIFEFEINGVKRGFKFGTYAFGVASREEQCSLDVLFKKIGMAYEVGKDEKGDPIVKSDPVDLLTVLNIFYGAAVNYAKSKKQPIDFGPSDVSDWTDELGLDKVNEMLFESLNQYQPKNSSSLAETGEVLQ